MNSVGLNRGEWSELYVLLTLFADPKIKVADENLNVITNQMYDIEDIELHAGMKYASYKIIDGHIYVYFQDKFVEALNSEEVLAYKNILFDAIINAPAGTGSFEIEGMDDFVNRICPKGIFKSDSNSKEDLDAYVLVIRTKNKLHYKYSIKSSLGSGATLLNASRHTNFLYKISNFDPCYIPEVNAINTGTKLVDRYNKIVSLGGDMSFIRVVSDIFNQNLCLIDEQMPMYLGNTLLKSYSGGDKDLLSLFMQSNQFKTDDDAFNVLGKLLEGICFGFFPGTLWSGVLTVNGGFLIVKNDGDVVLLDLANNRQIVLNYLVKNSKLDSPDSKRYHMFELSEKNGEVYFTLNLQIRFKN